MRLQEWIQPMQVGWLVMAVMLYVIAQDQESAIFFGVVSIAIGMLREGRDGSN